MNTNSMTIASFALLVALAGCESKSSAPTTVNDPPALTSVSTPAQASPEQPDAISSISDDQALRLNDQFVSPDADSEAVSDEDDSSSTPAAVADAIDPFADTENPSAVDLKFVTSATTNIFVTQQQAAYAREIDKRNKDLFAKRVGAQAEQSLVAKEAAAPAAPAATSVTPSPTASTPQAPMPPPPPVDEKKFLEDKQGQWATSASASSSYGQATQPKECAEACRKTAYSPWQATGAPNVNRYADDPASWTPRSGDAKDPEWLEVGFAKPVRATSIRIRQNAAPGVISRIDLIDEAQMSHTIWEGTDDTPYPKNTIGWFVKDIPRTNYRVTGARITIMPARVWGSNEIDAVQLVGE